MLYRDQIPACGHVMIRKATPLKTSYSEPIPPPPKKKNSSSFGHNCPTHLIKPEMNTPESHVPIVFSFTVRLCEKFSQCDKCGETKHLISSRFNQKCTRFQRAINLPIFATTVLTTKTSCLFACLLSQMKIICHMNPFAVLLWYKYQTQYSTIFCVV